MNKKRYYLSNEILNTIGLLSPEYHSEQLLMSLLKLHFPLYSNLEKNIKDLVTLFGSYIFLCLLESSRTIDDDSFKVIGLRSMTSDQKNRFTENWIDKMIQAKLMYQRFLETFLNQPDEKIIKKVKKVVFNGINDSNGKYNYIDENGIEIDYLKGINSSGTNIFLTMELNISQKI